VQQEQQWLVLAGQRQARHTGHFKGALSIGKEKEKRNEEAESLN